MNYRRSLSRQQSGIISCDGVIAFISRNWVDLAQTASITFGLLATCYTIRADARSRKVDNLLTITEHHRALWIELYSRPELRRVTRKDINIEAAPITDNERLFVLLLVLHLASSFRARKEGMYFSEMGLRRDVREFFNLPIPKVVWESVKTYQEKDFVAFVEMARTSNNW